MKTVIEIAKEAGIITNSPYLMPHDHVLQGIERFAELVRVDERERCAKLAEEEGWYVTAAAIRARSTK